MGIYKSQYGETKNTLNTEFKT